MTTKNHLAFMGFGKVQDNSEQVTEFKKYTGVAPMKIVAVNPTKEELSKIYGTDINYEPTYLGETEVDGKKVPQIRLDFILRTDKEEKETKDIDLITKVSLFIADAPKISRNKDKVEVVNIYGESAYIPLDAIKSKVMPDNMKWFNTEGMKPTKQGEVTLLELLRAYLSIPNRTYMKDNVWVEIKNPQDACCGIKDLSPLFRGDVSVIKDAIKMAPNNFMRVLVGVKNVEGKEYQDVFNRRFQKKGNTRIEEFAKVLDEAKGYGAYANTEFKVCKGLVEYEVEATDFSSNTGFGMPETTSMPGMEESDSDLPF